jgi:hypothetical protein
MQLNIKKDIILYDILAFTLLLILGSSVNTVLFEEVPIYDTATIGSISISSGDIKITTVESPYSFLLLHDKWADYADYDKLEKLTTGDKIEFVHRKYRIKESLFYFFYRVQTNIIGLSSDRLGHILDVDDYLKNRLDWPIAIFILVTTIPYLIIAFTILYSWLLVWLYHQFPIKYADLKYHWLIKYKLDKKFPPKK